MSEGVWLKCSQSGMAPIERYGMASVMVRGTMYVYGGAGLDSSLYSDLFTMTLSGAQVLCVILGTPFKIIGLRQTHIFLKTISN